MNPEQKLFVPHGVQSISVDGLRAEMAAVQGHSQDVHFNTRASRAVTRAHVLTRDDLREETRMNGAEDEKRNRQPLHLTASLRKETQRTLWNG